jgi:hypothetical protein
VAGDGDVTEMAPYGGLERGRCVRPGAARVSRKAVPDFPTATPSKAAMRLPFTPRRGAAPATQAPAGPVSSAIARTASATARLARRGATAMLDFTVARPPRLTKVDEFLDNPTRFLRKNHVAYRGDAPECGAGRIGEFVLIKVDEAVDHTSASTLPLRRNRPTAGAAFHIRAADKLAGRDIRHEAQPFQAYWSGFVPNGKVMCSLPATGPRIMLTPALTGCAVACLVAQNNTASFSHYNNKDPNATGDKVLPAAGIVALARADYPGLDGLSVMSSEYYRDTRNGPTPWETTVIGERTEQGGWSFWAQHAQRDRNDVHQIRDVEQLTPGLRVDRT